MYVKTIAHKNVDRLPSHGLTCQMILESLTVAQAQLGENFLSLLSIILYKLMGLQNMVTTLQLMMLKLRRMKMHTPLALDMFFLVLLRIR